MGVFLGIDQYRQKNWEGMVEKMCDRLSRWSWVLPQLSYRGRVLVTNNLAASALWHKMNVLDPPESVVEELQIRLFLGWAALEKICCTFPTYSRGRTRPDRH